MYSTLQLAKKYLHYYIKASNGKGHGIHSPFVFDFVTKILKDKGKYDCYTTIESIRKELLNNYSIIEVEDFGAGSTVSHTRKLKIKSIAKSSLKNRKLGQLIFRIAKYYHPKNIIELGTSLGITTSYLASSNINTPVITFEGSKEISKIARLNFEKLNLTNIQLITGNFSDTFQSTLSSIKKADFVFIDGNHRKEPTLFYFNELIKKTSSDSIVILDDIHWSREMEQAWKLIQQHDSVTLTIDLFFLGIVFFNSDFKVKQHFTIRF